MILTCELCQSQFLTESDPHVIIPGPEAKVYCYCQVKGYDDQRWIDQLKHEHKLYQKHLSGLKADNERLEAEITELKQKPMNDKDYKDYEAFNEYVIANKHIYFGVPSWEVDTDRAAWLAACNYKQREIDELEKEKDYLCKKMENMRDFHKHSKKILQDENAKLNQEIEKFKSYLEAWRIDE